MKKVLLIMFALVCFGATAKAQVCKISGSNDNVEVFGCRLDLGNNGVIVTVSNDSNDISANVTVKVEIQGKEGCSSCTTTVEGKNLAKPNQTTQIKIRVPSSFKLTENSRLKCTEISGSKCI